MSVEIEKWITFADSSSTVTVTVLERYLYSPPLLFTQSLPANIRRGANACLKLGRRLRRRPSFKPALGK